MADKVEVDLLTLKRVLNGGHGFFTNRFNGCLPEVGTFTEAHAPHFWQKISEVSTASPDQVRLAPEANCSSSTHTVANRLKPHFGAHVVRRVPEAASLTHPGHPWPLFGDSAQSHPRQLLGTSAAYRGATNCRDQVKERDHDENGT
jgi:hypothetical protein